MTRAVREYPLHMGMDSTSVSEVVGTDMVNWSEKDLEKYDKLAYRISKANTAGDVKNYQKSLIEMDKLWAKHGLCPKP